MLKLGIPEHGVLDAEKNVGGRKIIIRARQIKMLRGGMNDGVVSALVAVVVDTTPLFSDHLLVDKDEERLKIVKALYGTGHAGRYKTGKFGAEIVKEYPAEDFEADLLLWSRALYPTFIGASAGGYERADAKPTSPPWDVPGLVLRGLTSVWFGDAKAGKSTLQRLTAQSLECGVSGVVPVRQQEPVIWVNAEEDPAEHRRQFGNVNQALGLADRTSPIYVIHARGMSIGDLAQRLERAVRETGAKHVFIDSLSRLAQGMSLNNNETATLLIDALGSLPCSVNWIGHTGHDNTHRLAGSKHFTNAARLMVRVQSRMSIGGVSPELTRGVRTMVTEANGAAPTEPMYWTLNYHRDYGLVEAHMADPHDWPILTCTYEDYSLKNPRECGRQTWDGVLRSGNIRCSRHRFEEDEA